MSDEANFDILVHGAIGVDYLLQLDGAPAAGETRTIEREVRTLGGGAANCALTLATWGAHVCLCGKPPGNDGNGRFVAAQLAAVPNLTLHTSTRDDTETPYRVVLAAPDQASAILLRHSSGAENGEAAGDSTKPAGAPGEEWPHARLAACDGNSTARTYQVARQMHLRGVPLFARASAPDDVVTSLAEVVILTAEFSPQAAEEQLMHIACERAQQCGNTVVIMRGAQGIIWCRAGETAQIYASPLAENPDPIGNIGADDVYGAGLLWSRLQGWNWEQGLRFASVASALKCGQPEGVPSLGQIAAGIGDWGEGFETG
jgi:ribokinase